MAISLSDLSSLDDQARAAHARAIRSRLKELRERLGVRFPVYVMFTKADLIAGFTEFFEPMGQEERAQVWGFTLPFVKRKRGTEPQDPLASFDAEFDALLAQLNERCLERVQEEQDPHRRALVQTFPNQVASLRSVAHSFLGQVFQESRFEARQLLRGIYFVSGTQEGAPIDRLMMSMSRTFGIGRQAIGTGQGTGRSYFIRRLLDTVIFGEAGLVSKDDRVERRYKWIQRSAITAGVLALITGVTLWTVSYLGNAAMIAEARAGVDEYQRLAKQIPAPPIADDAVHSVVPALDVLRALPANPSAVVADPTDEESTVVDGEVEVPWELGWGLWQGDALGSEAAQTYRDALNAHLLPRLLVRLENILQVNMNNPELLYEALKVYLMLGIEGPLDRDLVQGWMAVDWSVRYAREPDTQEALLAHLDTLLSQPMQKISLNGPLVEQAQSVLAQTPLAERVYESIIKSPEARDLPKWRLTEIGGPAVNRVLVRNSGAALSEGVDGIYTRAGFYNVFLPNAEAVAERLRKESWVLGPLGPDAQSDASLVRLSRDVLNLYYGDFNGKYEEILGDVDILPMDSLGHATEVTRIISGPSSPVRNMLEAISEETLLTVDPNAVEEGGGNDAANKALKKQGTKLLPGKTKKLARVLKKLGGNNDGPPPPPPGEPVQQRFAWLHTLAKKEPGVPSELDGVIDQFSAVYDELNRLQFPGSAPAATEGGALGRLIEATGRFQGPLQRWANQVADGASTATAGGERQRLNQLWQAKVLPVCEQALSGRYPFDRTAQADVALRDFANLFAPAGLIDAFFNEHLLEHVDVAAKPWRWKPVYGAELGISDAVLAQFEKAGEIRNSFFLAAGPPSVTFDLKPVALSAEAKQVVLEVEGQQMDYAHGPVQTTPMTWPGKAGGRTRVAFQPELSGAANSLNREGPWAWFRLLDAAAIRSTQVSDVSRVIFSVGGRLATFELRAGSALNPFTLPALRSFGCPRSL